jgi:hypothetical protein
MKNWTRPTPCLTGRDSIPPEHLLRASQIQTLHSIRSERVLVEHIDYNCWPPVPIAPNNG